jgi:hypothetical protein
LPASRSTVVRAGGLILALALCGQAGAQDLEAQLRDNALWGEQQLVRQQALARELELKALENRLDTATNLATPATPGGTIVPQVPPGYVSIPDDLLAASRARIGAILREKH